MRRWLAAIITIIMMTYYVLPVNAADSVSDTVKTLMNEMTLRDKITQMLMVDFRYWDENLLDDVEQTEFTVMNPQIRQILEDYNFGAVIYFAQNLTGTEQAYNLTMDMQSATTKDNGIPMIICADQEGGSVYRLGTGTALPGNMALGATGDIGYARLAGCVIGSELSALGINTNLAPVVDVNNNANNPVIGLRSYSDNPVIVGNMASGTIAGMAKYNVIGCAKHFPGHGDTDTDSHYGLPSVDKSIEELSKCELLPYEIVIEQGVEMIMTAHILYPQLEKDMVVSQKTGKPEALPATMSDDIITRLLKEKMGFEGIVITDAMNMAGITENWEGVQAAVLAIQAGVDMICKPCDLANLEDVSELETFIQGITVAVEKNIIPMSRIDDAVSRILTVKKNRGILDWNESQYSLEYAKAMVGGTANREAERQIAAAAVTVVQNKDHLLPLNVTSESKVLMMVPYNNEKAQMIMGWNRAKEAGLIPDGAEVQVVCFDKTTSIDTYLAEILWADTIIFNSEISRAERMNGGRWESSYILETIAYAEACNKNTIVQSVDKPYDVQSYPNADAVLAVYGCKGSSVDPTQALVGGAVSSENAFGPNIIAGIEVIFGVFEAKGILPISIPEFSEGIYTEKIVYPQGFGLQYESR